MQTLFLRTMIVKNPNQAVLLGGREDHSDFVKTLKRYEDIRLDCPFFKGGVFINDNGSLIKYEMWTSESEYATFIEQNREFIRNLVAVYEEYCRSTGMQITRTGQTVSLESLTDLQKKAWDDRTFYRSS